MAAHHAPRVLPSFEAGPKRWILLLAGRMPILFTKAGEGFRSARCRLFGKETGTAIPFVILWQRQIERTADSVSIACRLCYGS